MRLLKLYLLPAIWCVSFSVFAQQPLGAAGSPAPAGSAPRSRLPLQVPSVPPPAAPSAALFPGQIGLNVVVTNRAGKPVSGLSQSNFTLLQDNHPWPIAAFHAWNQAAPGPPERLFLAIDTVNIRYDRVAYVREAVDAFLRQNNGRLPYPVTVLWVTDTGVEANSITTDNGDLLASQVKAAEGKLRLLNRNAGAWGDVEQFQMSVQMLWQIVDSVAKLPGRKLVVWLGPGWPMLDSPYIMLSSSQQTALFQQIVGLTTLMRQAQITLYSVSQNISDVDADFYREFLSPVRKVSDANPPNLALKVLAAESGGIAMEPTNDLQRAIDTCAADAQAYYTIVFQPPPARGPNEYHALKVRVDDRGLTARTVLGYYAQPPQAKH